MPHGKHQRAPKRETNPEIALKVRTMLSRSLSNIHTKENGYAQNNKSTEHPQNRNTLEIGITDNTKFVNQRDDTEKEYEKRKAELLSDCSDSEEETKPPKSILKTIPSNTQKYTTPNNETNQNMDQNKNKHSLYISEKNNNSETNLSINSSVNSEPPPVNFSTLPKKDPELLSKHWNEIIKPNEEENLSYDNPYYDTYNQNNDQAYVIEIQEGNADPQPVSGYIKKDKKKKILSFDNQVTEIDNSNFNDNSKRVSESESENFELNNDSYGNDYSNTKRTSYFHAGGTTFSSQAASIFFANKKPVNERRPTKFMTGRASVDSNDSQTSA